MRSRLGGDGSGAGGGAPCATGGMRASAVTVGIVFLGLAVVTALLAGSFWVVATGGGETGDPTEIDVDASRCTVSSNGDDSGVGTAILSVTYSGNGSVELTDATVRYDDEWTGTTLRVADHTDRAAASLENDSGGFDPRIERDERLTLTVPVERIRGDPLPSGKRASIGLVVDGSTVSSTGVRTPNGMSESQSFVAC